METRFVVQVRINGKWSDYRKNRASKTYTLTQQEAVAFMNLQPETAKVWSDDKHTMVADVPVTYRVIKSVKTNGLINQEIVAGDNS